MAEDVLTGFFDKNNDPIRVGSMLIDDREPVGCYYTVLPEIRGGVFKARHSVPGKKETEYVFLTAIQTFVRNAHADEVAEMMKARKAAKKEAKKAVEAAASAPERKTMADLLDPFTDQDLADELRRRGYEVTARKVTTVEL